MNNLTKRVTALESLAPSDSCRTCAERPVFTLGGPAEPCSECGREPFVFSISVDRAERWEDDAA